MLNRSHTRKVDNPAGFGKSGASVDGIQDLALA